MNKIKFLILIIGFSTHFIQIYPIATIENLKKMITKFADDDKSYITLYAAELNISYDDYLTKRRNQSCIELKNYISMFSPSLKGEDLVGKIEQDKLEWVNNICPGVLPKMPINLNYNDSLQDQPSKPADETNVSYSKTVYNTIIANAKQSSTKKNGNFESFHQINN